MTPHPARLGDVLRAWAALAPKDDSTASAVLRLVGVAPTREARRVVDNVPAGDSVDGQAPRTFSPKVPSRRRPRGRRRKPGSKRALRTEQLADGRESRRTAPETDEEVTPLDRVPAPGEAAVRPVSLAPLFAPRWRRSLLLGLVARSVESRQLDVEALVDALASQRPLARLPRKTCFRFARRVQLWIDMGLDMAPYVGDTRRLRDDLRALLDDESVESVRFVGDPRKGVRYESRPHLASCPSPAPDCAVVVLTWVDVGGPVRESVTGREWEGIVSRIERRGARAVLLTPSQVVRKRRRARNRLPVVIWDRSTSPSDVDVVVRGS